MDGGDDGDGFLCDVHPGEDSSGLADARQPLRQQLWGQVVQVQVQVVLPSGNAPFIERQIPVGFKKDTAKKMPEYENDSAGCLF